jgi:hypothetical protein
MNVTERMGGGSSEDCVGKDECDKRDTKLVQKYYLIYKRRC